MNSEIFSCNKYPNFFYQDFMLNPRLIASLFSVTMIVLGAGVACGQTTSTGSGQAYPNKVVRIVSSEPGGSSDLVARLIAQGLSGPLGQSVIVDNRGGGVIPGIVVAKAPPDGYTLLVYGSVFWTGTLLKASSPYDVVRDFAPISLTVSSPNILVVHPSLPVKSVKDLIALAKARPGDLNYSSGSAGASNHLAAELFKSMAGVNIVQVPYKGALPALNGLIMGEVHLMIASGSSAMPHVKSGRLRGLAVTSLQPSALFPGLPTVSAASLPGYEFAQTVGLFAPAKTPAAIINRLNQEIVRFLNMTETKERLLNDGAEAVGSSPEQFAAAIKSDLTIYGKLIKDIGIRPE